MFLKFSLYLWFLEVWLWYTQMQSSNNLFCFRFSAFLISVSYLKFLIYFILKYFFYPILPPLYTLLDIERLWILLSFSKEHWILFRQNIQVLVDHSDPMEAYFRFLLKVYFWFSFILGFRPYFLLESVQDLPFWLGQSSVCLARVTSETSIPFSFSCCCFLMGPAGSFPAHAQLSAWPRVQREPLCSSRTTSLQLSHF